MFSQILPSRTRKLSGASYSLTAAKRRPLAYAVAGLVLLALALGAAYFMVFAASGGAVAAGPSVADLRAENARLTAALAQSELLIKHEISTRESLEKQLAEQSEEIKKLKADLTFFQNNRGKPQSGGR